MILTVFLAISSGFLLVNAHTGIYELKPEIEDFSILVLIDQARTDENWSLCLQYNSNSDPDPASPGHLPNDCDFEGNEYSSFVVINAIYNVYDSIDISIYRSLIDASFMLEQNITDRNVFIFDFVLNEKTHYILLNDSSGNMISIPEFIRDSNQNIRMFTNSEPIIQITPSLHQIQTPNNQLLLLGENEIVQKIKDKPNEVKTNRRVEDILIDNLDETKIKTNSTPTKLTIIEQLLEESKNILPLTAKRSVETSTIGVSSPTIHPSKPTLFSILSTNKSIQTSTSQQPIQQTSKWPKVKAISIRAHPTPKSHHIMPNLETTQKPTTLASQKPTTLATTVSVQETSTLATTLSEQETSTLATNLTTTSLLTTTTQTTTNLPPTTISPTTKHKYKNEEERLMEFLMNPRPGSKVEIIGEDDTDENVPELIMFEIAAKETFAPFVPTFHPIPLRNPTPFNGSSTQAPCHHDPYPQWPYPLGGGMGQGNMHSIMQFGPQNPIAGNGMIGGFGNGFGGGFG